MTLCIEMIQLKNISRVFPICNIINDIERSSKMSAGVRPAVGVAQT